MTRSERIHVAVVILIAATFSVLMIANNDLPTGLRLLAPFMFALIAWRILWRATD